MSKPQRADKKSEALANHLHEKFQAIALTIFIVIISFILDYYNSDIIFTLTTISSILLSTIITHWGIPKLKNLKFKQVIRKEGPIKH